MCYIVGKLVNVILKKNKRGKCVIAVIDEIQLNSNVQLNGFQGYCLKACNALCSC